MNLKGKVVVITGASSGLGYEIAQQFVKKGVKVVNLSRTPSKLKITNIHTDLSKNEDIKNAVAIINKEYTDVDVLVSCAGVLHWSDIEELQAEEIDKDFAVNITGAIKQKNAA